MNLRPGSLQTLATAPLVALALLLVALPPAGAGGEPNSIPAVGSVAPEFTLHSQEGAAVSLRQFRGQWVVLYFYPKDMTTGCTIEAHGFQRDLAKYQQMKVQILGVSVDTVDSHRRFCAKDDLHFTLLSDTTHEVVARYGSLAHYGPFTLAARNTFLIDPEGVIRKVFVKVNPTPHSEEVLAALAELRKGQGN